MPSVDVAMIRWNEKTVYLCCRYTDMRKSINGLITLVQKSFSLAPLMNALFVFCNRDRSRIKILEWDGDGFWLYFKRFERRRFRWPTEGVYSFVSSLLTYFQKALRLRQYLAGTVVTSDLLLIVLETAKNTESHIDTYSQ
jgi:hypothetical protein